MLKQEWIGEYYLHISSFDNYKSVYINSSISLGKCLSEDEACEKAVNVLLRDFSDITITEAYIVNGWGQIIYM